MHVRITLRFDPFVKGVFDLGLNLLKAVFHLSEEGAVKKLCERIEWHLIHLSFHLSN